MGGICGAESIILLIQRVPVFLVSVVVLYHGMRTRFFAQILVVGSVSGPTELG